MREDPDFHIYFVGLVEQYPCIYDYNCLEYRNKSTQENAWRKIATEISESVHDCKERWKNLRGSYTRHLKSVYGDGKRRPYYLADHLSFLHPFTKTRATKNTDPAPECSALQDELHATVVIGDVTSQTSCEEDTTVALTGAVVPVAPGISRKRKSKLVSYESLHTKRTPMTNTTTTATSTVSNEQNTDPDYAFLLSILPDMQVMNGEQKRRFKIGILNLAGQILKKI